MISTIIGYFTWSAFSGVAGKLWKGFCDLIATPIGAALIAGLVMYTVGKVHEYRVVNVEWQTKWRNAEADAERERVKRDASIQAKVEADANQRLAALAARKDELERKVHAYEDEESKQTAVGNTCVTDGSDARWLRGAQRGRVKPEARSNAPLRLRALGR